MACGEGASLAAKSEGVIRCGLSARQGGASATGETGSVSLGQRPNVGLAAADGDGRRRSEQRVRARPLVASIERPSRRSRPRDVSRKDFSRK